VRSAVLATAWLLVVNICTDVDVYIILLTTFILFNNLATNLIITISATCIRRLFGDVLLSIINFPDFRCFIGSCSSVRDYGC